MAVTLSRGGCYKGGDGEVLSWAHTVESSYTENVSCPTIKEEISASVLAKASTQLDLVFVADSCQNVHLGVSRRTQVRFSAPTRQLTTAYNSSSREPDTLFWLP